MEQLLEQIAEQLFELRGDVKQLRQEMNAMGSELRQEMHTLNGELRQEMNEKWLELRQSIDSLAGEQVEMRKEVAFYYGSTIKKLDETRSELKSEIVQLGKVQQQHHQAVLEYLNNRGH
jgi:uncharacterized coiled-coil DUF342 family protein